MKAQVPVLKLGQVVEIYTEPYTQMMSQGSAELIEFEMNVGDGYSRWRVHFLGDHADLTSSRIIFGKPEE